MEADDLAKITNYAEYLERHPPIHRVEIFENTSWSCVHGIERWRGNCGCNSGGHPGWTQEWRGRSGRRWTGCATRWRRSSKKRRGRLLKDPWAARDDYISVVLDRSPAEHRSLLSRHTPRGIRAGGARHRAQAARTATARHADVHELRLVFR